MRSSQARWDIIFLACYWCTLGFPTNGSFPENLKRKVPRSHPYQMPKLSQLAPFWQLFSTPSSPQWSDKTPTLMHLWTNPPVNFMLDFTLTHEETPRYLSLFTWSMNSLSTPESSPPLGNYGLRLGSADSHSGSFTLGYKLPQCVLKVIVWWSQQNHKSSTKIKEEIQRSPKQIMSPPCLHRKKLSTNLKIHSFVWEICFKTRKEVGQIKSTKVIIIHVIVLQSWNWVPWDFSTVPEGGLNLLTSSHTLWVRKSAKWWICKI